MRRSFWLRLLNIFPEERWIVKNLFWLQFFQGAGIAFFFTAAFASFLDKYPITDLPWVMIISAFLLWFAGYFYSKLEHSIGNLPLSRVVTIFITASIVFFYIGANFIHASWFYFLMLAWFNVLYLLNNLEFWGIATSLFDTRQSKRLFGIISAGDIPAKFIGYTVALLIVSYIGVKNLLLTGALCMLFSIPYLIRISRSGLIAGAEQGHRHSSSKHKKLKTKEQERFNQLFRNLTLNALIRRIALLSLLVSSCIIIINFAFYSKVKEAYHDDVELAKFIAFFLASLRIIALIIKLIFTGRLINSLGIVRALFITPVIMILFILVLLGAGFSMNSDNVLLYIFAATAIAIDALRASINSPVLLTAMQPLPLHERLRAHNIVKGIMDPFASLLSGIILLVLYRIQGRVDLVSICYVLLVLAVFWLVGIFRVNHQYMQTLIKTITSRYFSREEFAMNNDEILDLISEKINKGNELEVINILQMLSSTNKPVPEELIQRLLKYPSDRVKLETIRMIGTKDSFTGEEELAELAAHSPDKVIKAEAIKTVSRMSNDEKRAAEYLNDPDPLNQQAAVTGMMHNKLEIIRAAATTMTAALSVSEDTMKRKTAVTIMREVKDDFYFPALVQLMKDADPETRDISLSAIGRATAPEAIEELLNHLDDRPKKVFLAIENSGSNALPVIISRIKSGTLTELQTERLISLIGRIRSGESIPVLIQLISTESTLVPYAAKALYRCNYQADEKTRKLLEDISHKYLLHGAELLHMQQILQQKKYPFDIIYSSINIELTEIRDLLLCLFACSYDRDKIGQARIGLNMKHREQIANAMEIIEMTVRKDLAHSFNSIYEAESIDHRCQALQKLFKEKNFSEVKQVLNRILSEEPIRYHHWTKATSMYVGRKSSQPLDHKLLNKFVNSEIQLLKETAIYAGSID